MSSARVVENDGQFAQWSPESVEWPLAANTLVLAIFEQFCVASKFVFGIRSFFTEMTIVRSLDIFMDLHSLFANGDIGRLRVNPGSAIEIIYSAFRVMLVHGGMGVAAENARRMRVTGMRQRALGDLGRQAQPTRAEPVEDTGQRCVFRIPFLQLPVEQRPDQIADTDLAQHEAVELRTMHADVAQVAIFPLIFLGHADAR